MKVWSVTNTANLRKDLGANEIDEVELLAEFEEVFEIDIPDEQIDELLTVKDWIDYLLSCSEVIDHLSHYSFTKK